MASGIPLTALLLRGLPMADGSAGAVDRYAAPYAALLFIMGTLVSWPQVPQPYALKAKSLRLQFLMSTLVSWPLVPQP